MDQDLEQYRKALRQRSRPIAGHGLVTATEELERVARWCREEGVEQDIYGSGELIEDFEGRVAKLFGHEAARFLPSGTMGQGIAMRIWCGADGHFGMHPTSHLELHEQRGYSHLFGLRSTLIGPARRVMLASDLGAVAEPISALIIELPTRENGGRLPSWSELEELCALARERGIKLHLDGARIWEAQAALNKSFEQIGALFDSIYVSFYKGIGALSGAMLIGPETFIGEAKLWQRRMGGNLYTLLPNVASAASRFDGQLERFPLYLDRARSLAAELSPIEGLRILPDPPHTSMMHIQLDLDPDEALRRRDQVAEDTGLWLLGAARALEVPGRCTFELSTGEALLQIKNEEVLKAFRALLAGPA